MTRTNPMRANASRSIDLMTLELPFRNSSGSMSGDNAFDDKGFEYIVKSYGTVIAKVRHDEIKNEQGEVEGYTRDVWVTTDKYSVTTSKHTTYARRAFNVVMPTKKPIRNSNSNSAGLMPVEEWLK